VVGRIHRVCCHLGPLCEVSSLFSYDSLKKCIYQLEKQQQGHEQILTYDPESNERSTLLAEQDVIGIDAMFIPLLDRELRKIATFYEHQEKELIDDMEDLEKSLLEQEDVGLGHRYYDDLTDEDDEDDSLDESPERRRQPSNHHRRRSVSGRRWSACAYFPSVAH
jgi:phosphate transporter